MRFLALLAACLLSVPLSAQNGDIVTRPANIEYGQSCNDNAIVFWLSAPKRDENLDALVITEDHAGLSSVALLAFGFMKDNLLIGYTGSKPCYLLVAPAWVTPFPLRYGIGSRPLFRVPNDPLLKGLPLFAQAYHLSPNGRVAMSRGQQMSVR